jgi:hypothetical protein
MPPRASRLILTAHRHAPALRRTDHIETLPVSFADRTPERVALIESMNDF